MLNTDKTLKIQGVYNTLYNATTRPDFKFAVTRYFIDEWVPLLGPSLAWLVVGLRQQCFWNQRRNWCIVNKNTLSEETGLDKRTIERSLKKPYSQWFVIDVTQRYRYRHQIGKKVRDKNRYQLLLDEPLSPRHQIGLAHRLEQVAPNSPDRLDAALTAIRRLLDEPNLNDKISYTGKIPKNLKRSTILEIIEESLGLNLAEHAADERLPLLDQHSSKLYNLIIQPNKIYVGWQYFRLQWTPLLGHALAWLVIYLRRHCYWDETNGELRDTYTAYKKELAGAIGQTSRNLANIMENPYFSLFCAVLNPNDARNKPTTFQTRMVDDPLTPDDQLKVANDLAQRLQGEFYGRNPESGQLDLFPILDRLSKRQNFAYGQVSENLPPNDAKKSRPVENSSEKMPQHRNGSIRKNAATKDKDSLIPTPLKIIQEQQVPPVVAAQSTGLETLMNDLLIQEPVRSRLLANPDLTVSKMGAWYLYAETQPGLFDPRGYMINRLLANDSPPSEFLAFAGLDDVSWQLFENSIRLLKSGQPLVEEIPPAQMEIFMNWANVYGQADQDEIQRLLSLSRRTASKDTISSTPGFAESEKATDPLLEEGRRLWQIGLEQLQLQMTRETFDTWLRQTEVLEYDDHLFVIDAKNSYAKEWLENRLARVIKSTLTGVVGEAVSVRFVVPELR